MHYLSKCEDYKLMEIKMEQTKQDYESHINQLITRYIFVPTCMFAGVQVEWKHS